MESRRPGNPAERLLRAAGFCLFGTTGMLAIGLALLAGPMAGFYADQDRVLAQEQRLVALEELRQERAELISRAEDPSVVERAAMDHLNYLPPATLERSPGRLPASWPALESALAGRGQQAATEPGRARRVVERLADQPGTRSVLIALGSGLVIISLACFNRRG